MDLESYCKKEDKDYLISEWYEEMNLPYTFDTIAHSSSISVWWKCKNNHIWQTQLKSRSLSRTECPKCNEERRMERINNKLRRYKQK